MTQIVAARPMPDITRVPASGFGPEDAVVAADGTVFAALRDDGVLVRVAPGAKEAKRIADLGGRGLGVELMPDGSVLVCNADLGLQRVDSVTGDTMALLDAVDGEPFSICNNASVAADGTIYVSESSRAYDLGRFRVDIVEDSRSGRLLRWQAGSAPQTLLDGLAFANGVALSPDEDFVLVAETGKNRIHRVWLKGGRAGEAEIFADTPGFPDNLSVGDSAAPDGGPLFWVAIPALPNPQLGAIHALPRPLRALIARVPERFGPKAAACCRVAAYGSDGKLIHMFDGDPSAYHHVTGVRERGGRVWMGSIFEDALAWFDLLEGA